MNYFRIDKNDDCNGPGFRVVLWVAGCSHHCKGCQNPYTWDEHAGSLFTDKELDLIIEYLKPDYIQGITFSGGDPIYANNLYTVANIIKKIKKVYNDKKDIWIYTGYNFQRLLPIQNIDLKYILNNSDVIVDGEFKEELYDGNLIYRGSSNQNIIDVKQSLKKQKIILYDK